MTSHRRIHALVVTAYTPLKCMGALERSHQHPCAEGIGETDELSEMVDWGEEIRAFIQRRIVGLKRRRPGPGASMRAFLSRSEGLQPVT